MGIDLRERFGMEEEDKGEMCVREKRESFRVRERREKFGIRRENESTTIYRAPIIDYHVL